MQRHRADLPIERKVVIVPESVRPFHLYAAGRARAHRDGPPARGSGARTVEHTYGLAGAGLIDLLAVEGHAAPAGRSESRAGRTNSAIAALNLSGSSTNGSWPECSNQTSFLEGAVSASKYARLVSGGTQ
jgi:hypothetical protein